MRGIWVVAGVCSLLLTGCMIAPGQDLDVRGAKQVPQHQAPHVKPIIIKIDTSVVHTLSHGHRCVANNNKQWLCDAQDQYEYRAGPQDILNIIVWDHPELSNPQGDYRSAADTGILINADGSIFYPFAGRLQAAGLTVEEIRENLTSGLEKFIQTPQISVRVAQFNSQRVQVMGEILTPNVQPITNVPLTLLNAINSAGGMNPNTANARYVYVIRGPAAHPTLFWLNANQPDALLLAEQFYLQNNDIVYVSTADIARWQRIISSVYPTVQAGFEIHNQTK